MCVKAILHYVSSTEVATLSVCFIANTLDFIADNKLDLWLKLIKFSQNPRARDY